MLWLLSHTKCPFRHRASARFFMPQTEHVAWDVFLRYDRGAPQIKQPDLCGFDGVSSIGPAWIPGYLSSCAQVELELPLRV
jgi:hypothetical protein